MPTQVRAVGQEEEGESFMADAADADPSDDGNETLASDEEDVLTDEEGHLTDVEDANGRGW